MTVTPDSLLRSWIGFAERFSAGDYAGAYDFAQEDNNFSNIVIYLRNTTAQYVFFTSAWSDVIFNMKASEDFYREIASFTGASNRLEKICETADCVAYKDFAHSPSKLKATVNAVRERYPEKKLVACMELHTFSSLMADFLPQYKGCMADADVAFVYFNPKVIEHKRLTPITAEEVRDAFGTKNVEVFTESEALQARLKGLEYKNTALLMMSSGTFDGINVKEFAKELLHG